MHVWTINVQRTVYKQEASDYQYCKHIISTYLTFFEIKFRILTKYIVFKTFLELEKMHNLLKSLYLLTDCLVNHRLYSSLLFIHIIKFKNKF